jgi:Tol biopolymer transport system component
MASSRASAASGGPIVLPLPEHHAVLLSPNGARLLVNTPSSDKQTHAVSPLGVLMEALNLQTFVTDAATARSRTDLPPCDRPVWSPDGSRLACAGGQEITIVDVGTRNEAERIRFSEHHSSGEPYATPVAPEAWSPDGRTLLVSTYGGNSTSPASDYFLADVPTRSWTRAMTGNNAVWLAGRNALIYSTPRDLAPLPASGAHRVWSAHLAIFALAARRETLLTSGVTNNEQPTLCVP